MATVTPDLVYNQRYTYNQQGGQYIRRFLVSGLSSADPAAVLYDAVNACGIAYGDPHPSIPGIYASNFQADPFDKSSRTQAFVLITYSSPQLSNSQAIRISSTTQNEPYSQDPVTKLPILVFYKGVADTVKLDVPICKSTIEFTRIERGSPLSKSTQYVGTCNSDSFQGGAPLTWRCRAIDGEWLGAVGPNAGGYRVTYVFENAGQGNDFTQSYLWVDRVTHRVAEDSTATPNNSNGLYTYKPRTNAFSGLSIPSV